MAGPVGIEPTSFGLEPKIIAFIIRTHFKFGGSSGIRTHGATFVTLCLSKTAQSASLPYFHIGDVCRTRTYDQRLNGTPLYQLS